MNLLFLKFLYSFFVFCKWCTYVNMGCLKCISGINLSPANKNLFTISSILYVVLTWLIWNKRGPTKWILLTGVFVPKPLKNRLASCSLINLGFLLTHSAHFDKGIILPFFVFTTWIFTFCIFSTLQTIW